MGRMAAAPNIPVVTTIADRLRSLLSRARTVKESTSIEPPLQLSDFESDVSQISQHQADKPNGVEEPSPSVPPQLAALETAAKTVFYHILARNLIDEPEFVDMWNLLDLLQFCANYEQCDASLTFWLIEELLDSQTIKGCRRVFDYLESRRERLMTSVSRKSKELIILRSCNELLRRLSRAEDAVFCGRVFIFLFQSFPLGDKSSVNLRGEFHVENVTIFDDIRKGETVKKDDEMAIDVPKAGEKNTQSDEGKIEQNKEGESKTSPDAQQAKVPEITVTEASAVKKEGIDMDSLYTMFWSLQHIFSNPPKIFEPEEFEKFKRGLEVTVEKFKEVPKVIPHTTGREPMDKQKGVKRKRGDIDEFASNFNPKYLTSRDLFELELSDLTFQRHILVQALVLIEFLLSLTPKAKNRIADLKAQKAMLYSHTLSDDDTKWATSMRDRIGAYLQSTQEGRFYYRMVDNILSRDKNWVRWKLLFCPPISLPPVPLTPPSSDDSTSILSARNSAKKAFVPRRMKAQVMGSIDLSFLSERGSNYLENLRAEERLSRPDPASLLRKVDTADLDLDFLPPLPVQPPLISDEELKKGTPQNKKVVDPQEAERQSLNEQRAAGSWRLMRMKGMHDLRALSKVDESDARSLKTLVEEEVPAEEEERHEDGGTAGVENGEGKDPLANTKEIKAEQLDLSIAPSVDTPAASSTPVDTSPVPSSNEKKRKRDSDGSTTDISDAAETGEAGTPSKRTKLHADANANEDESTAPTATPTPMHTSASSGKKRKREGDESTADISDAAEVDEAGTPSKRIKRHADEDESTAPTATPTPAASSNEDALVSAAEDEVSHQPPNGTNHVEGDGHGEEDVDADVDMQRGDAGVERVGQNEDGLIKGLSTTETQETDLAGDNAQNVGSETAIAADGAGTEQETHA